MNTSDRSFYTVVLLSIVCILKVCAEGIPDGNVNYFNQEQPIKVTDFVPEVETPYDESQVKRDTANSEGTARAYPGTFLDLLQRVYTECIQEGSFTCVKPKFLSYLSSSVNQDSIRITRDLSIVRKEGAVEPSPEYYQQMAASVAMNRADNERRDAVRLMMLERVDDFLDTHELRMRVPKELLSGEMLPFVPKFFLNNIPEEIRVPLTSSSSEVGRRKKNKGFLKKFVIPFLLGLKFKLTALVPLAIAMIALKTWKALTLGLLSLVLSGAMVLFKLTKPKLQSYELVHYPHHHHHMEHYDHHHGYGKSMDDAQPLAYNAYYPQN